MSKAKKLILIISSSLLAMVLVASLVLGLIKTSGLNDFSDFSSVVITDANGQSYTILKTESKTPENEDQYFLYNEFSKALKSTRYSILRGWMEGIGTNSYRFVTEDVTNNEWVYDEDEKDYVEEEVTTTQKVEISRNDIGKLNASANGYSITFRFDRDDNNELKKCVKVQKETIYFDTATFVLSVNTANIIENYTLHLYDSQKLVGTLNETYSINPITINAKAFSLHQSIQDTIFPYFL